MSRLPDVWIIPASQSPELIVDDHAALRRLIGLVVRVEVDLMRPDCLPTI